MVWYRNIGNSPWRRKDGTMVPPGGAFDATEREHARIFRRSHYSKRLALMDAPPEKEDPPVDEESTPATSADVAVPDALPSWDLKLPPQLYLERFPKGPHSKLARQLIKAAKKATGA